MSKSQPTPKAGDKCPVDGGELKEMPAPTPAQRAAAADRENPIALPRHLDTATEAQRAELGPLFVCQTCGYKTRIPAATTSA